MAVLAVLQLLHVLLQLLPAAYMVVRATRKAALQKLKEQRSHNLHNDVEDDYDDSHEAFFAPVADADAAAAAKEDEELDKNELPGFLKIDTFEQIMEIIGKEARTQQNVTQTLVNAFVRMPIYPPACPSDIHYHHQPENLLKCSGLLYCYLVLLHASVMVSLHT